jgi:hypothetical protein
MMSLPTFKKLEGRCAHIRKRIMHLHDRATKVSELDGRRRAADRSGRHG